MGKQSLGKACVLLTYGDQERQKSKNVFTLKLIGKMKLRIEKHL